MAVTNGWGQGVINNTNGWGKLATNNIGAGSVYENSASGDTALIGTSAAFSYSASSFTQADSDPTPTITGTTGGTFSGTTGLVFVSTSTGQIDLSASTIAAHVVTYTVGGVSSNFNLSVTAASFASTQSFNFDGVDDFIQLNSTLSFANEFTISIWVKPNGFSTSQVIVGNGSSSSNWIRLSSSSEIDFKVGGGGGTTLNFTDVGNNLVDGVWQHLLLFRDSSDNFGIFRNGSAFSSSQNNGNTFKLSTFAKRGNIEYTGSLDEVAVWNSDQSSNVSSIYSSGVPNNLNDLSTPPTAWIRMGEHGTWDGAKWTLIDQGTSSNNAESVNMVEADRETDVPT